MPQKHIVSVYILETQACAFTKSVYSQNTSFCKAIYSFVFLLHSNQLKTVL